MNPKIKFNVMVLVGLAIALIPFLTIFNRTFAAEFSGRSLGFGLGLIVYPVTGLPLLIFSWFTRSWNLLSAASVATCLFLVFFSVTASGLAYIGERFDWQIAIAGALLGTTVGLAIYQIVFILVGSIISKNRSKP